MMKKLLLFILVVFLVSASSLADTEKNSLILRGDNHLQQGDIEQSIFYYTQAIIEDPKNVTAYLKRARAYFYLRKLHLAMDDYYKALELDPEAVHLYLKSKKSGWLQYNDAFWQTEQ